MFYEHSLTIPASTAKANQVKQDMILTHGIIHRVEVEFPYGCAGLVHVVIFRFEHPVWPTNPEEAFTSGGYVIAFNEFYSMEKSPYTMSIRGWAPNTTYQHIIKVRLGILPREVLIPPAPRQGILGKLLGK